MYRIYLMQGGEQILLPVTPSQIRTKTARVVMESIVSPCGIYTCLSAKQLSLLSAYSGFDNCVSHVAIFLNSWYYVKHNSHYWQRKVAATKQETS